MTREHNDDGRYEVLDLRSCLNCTPSHQSVSADTIICVVLGKGEEMIVKKEEKEEEETKGKKSAKEGEAMIDSSGGTQWRM